MEPLLLTGWNDPPDPARLEWVVGHLSEGGLLALPTETVYGFGCAADPGPVDDLMTLKGRGPDRPFLVLVPDREAVARLAWTEEARELARVFWPGALTLILEDPEGLFPPGIRSPRGTVAVRRTPHSLARRVVEALGRPMVSTSANLPCAPPALSAREAWLAARALVAGPRLWVLDGGALDPSEPSTLVDCTGSEPKILRAGAVPVHRLRCVLPEIHDPV
jgi:L-threonylcarbamoyladenylate synthase